MMKHFFAGLIFFIFSLFLFPSFVQATDITFTSFTASSYELGEEGVTYTYTFTIPQTLPTSGSISIQLVPQRSGTDGAEANFCDATLAAFTDDGDDLSGSATVRAFSSGPGVCSGQGIVVEGDPSFSQELAAGSVIAASFANVTNPSLEGTAYHSIVDNYINQTDSDAVSWTAFGDPLLKITVVEPDGTTPVALANVWIHNTYYTKSASLSTHGGGNAYFYANDFWVPSGIASDDTYSIHVEAPTGSGSTNANVVTGVAVASGEINNDYFADGAEGPIRLSKPLMTGTMVVPAGCTNCVAAEGDAITDVDIDVRDASYNPSNFSHTRVNDSGVFTIGGLSGSETGTTYVVEFHSPYDMSNYKGLIPPAVIEELVVYDTDGDGITNYVKYDSNGDDVLEQTNFVDLPIALGNFPFRLASKTISGRITNIAGDPVNGASVRAFKMMNPEMVQTTTDSDGDYSLLVGGGSWMFMPELDMHTNFDDDADNDVSAEWVYCGMGKSATFENDTSTETSTGNNFTVKTASVTIIGAVKDPSGNPFTGGNGGVSIFSKNGCGSNSAIDPMDGTFSVGVPPGTYEVSVHTWQQDYSAPASTVVTATSGTVNVGSLQLSTKQARISGRLWADANENGTYDSGEGVGNVRVEAFKAAKKFDEFSGGPGGGPMGGGGDWSSTTSSNDTDTKGNFELNVTKGTWVVNVMADPGMMGGYSTNSVDYIYTGAPTQVQLSSDTSQSTGNNFELGIADATINGRVVNSETDVGIGGVYGYAFAEPAGTYGQSAMMGMGMGAMISNSAFTIKVPAGDYRIGVDFPPETSGYTPASTATVTAVSGETVTVDVPVTPNNATVRIQFKDSAGSLVTDLAHAEVFMDNGAGGHQWRIFSQSELTTGKVDIQTAAGVWNIGYYISPTETDYMSQAVNDNKVTAMANETVSKDITLQVANSTVSGTVYTPDGDPLSGVFVSLDSRKASTFNPVSGPIFMSGDVTGADGTYSLTLPAGTYQVSAFFPPSATVAGQEVSYLNPGPQEATIDSSSPATANFTFGSSDATITGKITLDGVAQGAFIAAYSDQGGYSETTSLNGNYSLNATSSDKWYMRAIYEIGNSVYFSELMEVVMGGASSLTQNLALSVAPFTIPDAASTTFNCAGAKKITLSNGAEISIPANAIKPSSVSACNSNDSSSNITVTVSPTAQMSLQDKSIPVGIGYEITAKDSNGAIISDTFNSNVTITIPYSDNEIATAMGGAVDEDLLGNGYWDTATSAWRTVDNQVLDTTNNTLTVSTNHFTLFGVLAAADPSATSGASSVSAGVASGTTSSGGTSKPMAPKDVGSIIEGGLSQVILMIPARALEWDADFEISMQEYDFVYPKFPLWIATGPFKIKMKSWWNSAEFGEFLEPVTLVIRYDPNSLGAIPEKSLRLNYYDFASSHWRPINSLLISDRNEVAAVINDLKGTYALIGGFGYQGSYSYTEQTVTAESSSEEIGLSEEILPQKEIISEQKHPSAMPEPAPVKESWFKQLINKIFSFIK
ncbi:MAG: carboxypeptidase regulatory-like domain-containing protein [Candidatus Shapirobacteria bacterium]